MIELTDFLIYMAVFLSPIILIAPLSFIGMVFYLKYVQGDYDAGR
jgi:multisubunit Na+/H+ antiporter MnhF subunit